MRNLASFPLRLRRRVARAVRNLTGQPPGAPEIAVQTFAIAATDLANAEADTGAAELGAPVSHWVSTIVSEDGAIESGVWDSSAGRHVIRFDFDEWVHILEGEVHVTAVGRARTLRAGDVAFFHAGVEMIWDVPTYVRKVWVQRHPRRGPVSRTTRRVVGILTSALRD